MEQFVPDGKGNEDMVEKSSKDFPSIDQHEIMKRTSVGNALKVSVDKQRLFPPHRDVEVLMEKLQAAGIRSANRQRTLIKTCNYVTL